MSAIDKDTGELLKTVADFDPEKFLGAFNIRSNCMSIGRRSTRRMEMLGLRRQRKHRKILCRMRQSQAGRAKG